MELIAPGLKLVKGGGAPGGGATRRRLAQLHRAHGALLLDIARKLCRHDAEARDLVQDTWEYTLKHIDKPWSGRERGWLLTVMMHRFYDYCRKRQRTDLLEGGSLATIEQTLASDTSPEACEAAVWASLTFSDLRVAIEKLPEGPEHYRTLCRMKYVEHRSLRELTAYFGIPQGTVGTRLMRGRRMLKDILLKTVQS